VPIAPDRTLTISDSFYGDDVTEEEIASIRDFGNQVFAEDQALVESIQRAAASGGLNEGRLMLSSEHLIQHFQRLVERTLA
jgi:phenylpropionate dioxygenase-like ring-hydroxylating dioxygenase large terminal subunit